MLHGFLFLVFHYALFYLLSFFIHVICPFIYVFNFFCPFHIFCIVSYHSYAPRNFFLHLKYCCRELRTFVYVGGTLFLFMILWWYSLKRFLLWHNKTILILFIRYIVDYCYIIFYMISDFYFIYYTWWSVMYFMMFM